MNGRTVGIVGNQPLEAAGKIALLDLKLSNVVYVFLAVSFSFSH